MPFYSRRIQRILNKWPGKQRLGMYRFLPLFFVLGATLEFSMINWTVGETNFYKTFKKRQAKNFIEEKLHTTQVQVNAITKEASQA
ncbi:ubiquinol-cytochrome c reductase complex assembly factor 5 [Eurosta solidaginis]|uniref:ubiquinol-cytochrome c reductase complex assembly factor 5 n=1 Tax=Eurosta solidaginis TaxID=178769 RepID=UPI003530BEC2